jgi:hypothetical protein
MELANPLFVPSVSFSFHHDPGGLRPISIFITASRHDAREALREASTSEIRNFLLMLDEEHGIYHIHFNEVYLERAFVFTPLDISVKSALSGAVVHSNWPCALY